MGDSWEERKEARRRALEERSDEAKARKLAQREWLGQMRLQMLILIDKAARLGNDSLSSEEESFLRFNAPFLRMDVEYEKQKARSRAPVPENLVQVRDRYADLVLLLTCGSLTEIDSRFHAAKREATLLAGLLGRQLDRGVEYATLVFRAAKGDVWARSAAGFLATELRKSLELDLETARAFDHDRVLATLT